MMVIAVGLSSYNIALFHLVNHAFYKALLFLGAGAVIHAVGDNQDFRKYGGLRAFLPLTYSVMLIASLSLVAFPFMTGFYSKDFILESAYGQFYFSGTVVYFIATIGAMFTTLYSVKVLYLTFLTNPNGPVVNYKQANEGDIFMSLPLMILAIFSIFFGYITKDIFIGLGSGFFADNSLFIHPTHEIMLDTEFAVPTLFKLLPLIFTVSLSVLAIILSEFLPKILIFFKFSRLGYNIFGFFNQRFLIELFYNKYVTGLILKLGGQTTKIIDKGSVELLGPYGLEKSIITLSRNIASLDTKVVTSYALYILIGLIFYLLIPYLAIIDNSLLLLLIILALYNFNISSLSLPANKFSVHKASLFTDVSLYLHGLITKVKSIYGGEIDNNKPVVLNEFALLTEIKGKKISSQEKAPLVAVYPFLLDIENELAYDFSEHRKALEEGILYKGEYKPLDDLYKLILLNNKEITIVGKSSPELKKKFLNFIDYNTPSPKNLKVTALTGTSLSQDSLYLNILAGHHALTSVFASYYLALTGSWFLNALNYYENVNNTHNKLYYDWWLGRQLSMGFQQGLDIMLQSKDIYISAYGLNKDLTHRELLEDNLYIVLNLILKHSLFIKLNKIGKIQDKKFLVSEEYDILLKSVMQEHYNLYKQGYIYLEELRVYNLENFTSSTKANQIPDDNELCI